MSNNYFSFKQFTVLQDKCAFKTGTDSVILGAYADITCSDNILDIGTGTGLIALMLAQKGATKIIAIEPDKDSYQQACLNIENSKWSDRIKVENTDLQSFNPVDTKFNLIVTNPPYFRNSLRNPDSRKAATRHNDTLSSDVILKAVSGLLAEDGRFLVVMPYVEGNVFIAEAVEYGLYCADILKIKPLPKSEIRRLILEFRKTRAVVSEKFLTIERGRRHEFTEDYTNLTKDFYLNF